MSRAEDPEVLAPLVVDDSELVWDSDRDTLFGNYAAENFNTVESLRGGQALAVNISRDEHFMRWMRPSAHPSAFFETQSSCCAHVGGRAACQLCGQH